MNMKEVVIVIWLIVGGVFFLVGKETIGAIIVSSMIISGTISDLDREN